MQQPSKLLKEGSTSASKYHKNGRDVISKLPDDFIYQIISHLTLRGAVKPSVLLHRWKSVFCYLKDLKFDRVNMFQDSGNSGFLETCESPCREYRNKFVRAVNQFLDFYHGTEVHEFEVSFCLRCDFSDDIDRWVRFSIRMGAEKLSTRLYYNSSCCRRSDDEFGGQSEGKYIFRSELFEGRENEHLKYLRLICSSEDMDRGKLEHSERVHKHLKKVDIGGFYDTLNQNEFAIYLLKHAISLERLVINPEGKYCSGLRQSWDEGEREKVYQNLHEFSKDAVLTIH